MLAPPRTGPQLFKRAREEQGIHPTVKILLVSAGANTSFDPYVTGPQPFYRANDPDLAAEAYQQQQSIVVPRDPDQG